MQPVENNPPAMKQRCAWRRSGVSAFLLLGGVFGLGFLVAMPPFQAPDEYAHFYRAYHVSEGGVLGIAESNRVVALLPQSLEELPHRLDVGRLIFEPENNWDFRTLHYAADLPLQPEDRIFTRLRGGIYSPAPYLPQALAIALGRWCGGGPLLLFYLGRVGNLLAWLVLVGMAIHRMPTAKWLLFFLAIAPMNLMQAASLSADATTTASVYLLLATTLALSQREAGGIHWKETFQLLILAAVLGLSKNVYCFLAALPLLLRPGTCRSRGHYLVTALGPFLCAVGLAAWWIQLSKELVTAETTPMGTAMFFTILADPAAFLSKIGTTLNCSGGDQSFIYCYYQGIVGIAGWMNIFLPAYAYQLFAVIFVFLCLTDHAGKVRLGVVVKLLLAMLVVATGFLVFATAEALFCDNSGPVIVGLQGRYFIPLVPLVALLCHHHGLWIRARYRAWAAMAGGLVLLVCSLIVIVIRYYG